MEGSGYWKDDVHYCPDHHETQYQLFSGGREWYCPICEYQGYYPAGGPNSPRKLLAERKVEEFRAVMRQELEKRKGSRQRDV